MLAYSCVVGICWVLIGSALGFSLKPLISVCAAVALAYTWYAIVPATSPGVLRHLAGDFLACCSLDTTLDVKAIGIAVAGIVGVTLLVVSAAALLRHRRKLYMAALLLGLLAIVGSTFWAQKLTEFGLVQRDSAQIVCVSDVCAWPEVGPDPRKVDTSGAGYAAVVSIAEASASKTSGATRLHQECRRRVL